MVLYFKSLELHNFGSYASAKFDLTNHGFCAVTGKNLCKKDNSTSNGSGKSTPWSAICYAITGETISGLTNNLKNINVDENECWVKLDLLADNNSYEFTRADVDEMFNAIQGSLDSVREEYYRKFEAKAKTSKQAFSFGQTKACEVENTDVKVEENPVQTMETVPSEVVPTTEI